MPATDPLKGDVVARRRFVYFVIFLVGTAVLAVVVLSGIEPSPQSVRDTIHSWGVLAPIAFILILAARPFIFFPSTLLFIAGGLAFGSVLGTLYSAVGGTTAAVITFVLARSLGREFVQARLPPRWRRFQEDEWGAGVVFFLNLVPIVPITAINYAAGLSRVSLRQYTLAVIGGLTPRAFAYSYFGDSLLEIGSRQFAVALLLLAVLVIVPTWLRRLWFARQRAQREAQKSENG
jgi:uncharacterized membrane protein YdjX (TVP38/TMEM64 family)